MALTHVCVWDSQTGYRRISSEEAAEMYPYGTVSARSGHFVCELCAQNVCFTAPGVNARHFRHDSAAQNKACEERQRAYSASISSLNNHPMPIRIQVTGTSFVLQLGFFSPANGESRPRCKLIKIGGDAHQLFEYAYERIESSCITYLSVGDVPSQKYHLIYEQPSTQLYKFWPSSTPGVSSKGSFFDAVTGKMLQIGAKASPGKSYYLLQRVPMYSFEIPDGITIRKITETRTPILTTWSLYKLDVNCFSESVARFFLKRSVFLTEKPTVFYPIWPPYVETPYFLCHRNNELYFFMRGENAELKTFPITRTSVAPLSNAAEKGKLYCIMATSKEQLLSLGNSGALGFSYLMKKELDYQTEKPSISVTDSTGAFFNDETYNQLPKSKRLAVLAPFDGKAIVRKNGKIQYIYRVPSGENIEIDQIAFGIQIEFYQGCDHIRTLSFEKRLRECNKASKDAELAAKLENARGEMISIPHSIGAIAGKLQDYSQTNLWLRQAILKGEMPRQAYRLLVEYIRKVNEGSE